MAVFARVLAIVAAGLVIGTSAAPSFKGDFEITNLIVDSPFQRAPTSTENSTITFEFCDQDRPATINCAVEWKAGLPPPSKAGFSQCEDKHVQVYFPAGTYNGTTNFLMSISHNYQDDSLGERPYNSLTKFADLNITFLDTPDYGCDIEKAHCISRPGSTIIAKVTRAVG